MGNNMESKFVNQRRHYLEQYLKKMSAFDFLIESEEFKIFSRPKGDIEKTLKAHKKPLYKTICQKYLLCFDIQVHLYDQVKRDELAGRCTDYLAFSKKIQPVLKAMLEDKLISFINNKD